MALCAADDGSRAAQEAARQLDPSCKLPACGAAPPQLVIGTLDLNIGVQRSPDPDSGRDPGLGNVASQA